MMVACSLALLQVCAHNAALCEGRDRRWVKQQPAGGGRYTWWSPVPCSTCKIITHKDRALLHGGVHPPT